MDNNPFRSHQPQTGNYMTPTMGAQQQQQQQQPQQQQPPYQSNYSMGGGYNTMGTTPQNGYQQQQSWQYQQPQTGIMSPTTPQQSNFASTLPQKNSFTSSLSSTTAGPPPSQFSPYSTNASLMPSTATNNVSTPPQMNTFGAGGNTYQPYGMPTPNTGNVNYPNNNSMMFNSAGYQQPYQQQQHHDPSNFYIPPNFGMSTPTTTTNNNMFQPQQPRHAPVDASSLLKGTQVRRVECPVCQKMIEGDDMAVNHHVNEHYS